MAGILGTLVNSAPVIQYAQGASQKAAMPVADFLAPVVNVGSTVGTYTVYDEKARFRLPNTKRAPMQKATNLRLSGKQLTYRLTPHALDVPVDIIERDGGLFDAGGSPISAAVNGDGANVAAINLLQEAADEGAEVGNLDREKETIDLAIAALTGGALDITLGTDDPVAKIDAGILTVLKAAKYGSAMGARVLCGATALASLKNDSTVRGRFIVGQGAPVGIVAPNEANLGQLFLGSPQVRASFMVYDDAPEGVAEDIQFILDNSIIVFAALPAPRRHDPSFMKCFMPRGQWMVPGTYLSEDQRQTVAKFDWWMFPFVGNASAGQLFNVVADGASRSDLADAKNEAGKRISKAAKEAAEKAKG
jgi:hypothetical protein